MWGTEQMGILLADDIYSNIFLVMKYSAILLILHNIAQQQQQQNILKLSKLQIWPLRGEPFKWF